MTVVVPSNALDFLKNGNFCRLNMTLIHNTMKISVICVYVVFGYELIVCECM